VEELFLKVNELERKEREATSDAGEQAVWSRLNSRALKMALICACSKGEDFISVESAKTGIKVALKNTRDFIKSYRKDFVLNEFDGVRKKFLDYIRKRPAVTKRMLTNNFRMKSIDIYITLSSLIDGGAIEETSKNVYKAKDAYKAKKGKK
jgi:hypothetical protein